MASLSFLDHLQRTFRLSAGTLIPIKQEPDEQPSMTGQPRVTEEEARKPDNHANHIQTENDEEAEDDCDDCDCTDCNDCNEAKKFSSDELEFRLKLRFEGEERIRRIHLGDLQEPAFEALMLEIKRVHGEQEYQLTYRDVDHHMALICSTRELYYAIQDCKPQGFALIDVKKIDERHQIPAIASPVEILTTASPASPATPQQLKGSSIADAVGSAAAATVTPQSFRISTFQPSDLMTRASKRPRHREASLSHENETDEHQWACAHCEIMSFKTLAEASAHESACSAAPGPVAFATVPPASANETYNTAIFSGRRISTHPSINTKLKATIAEVVCIPDDEPDMVASGVVATSIVENEQDGAVPLLGVQFIPKEGSVHKRICNALLELKALNIVEPPRIQVALFAGYSNVKSTGFQKALTLLSKEGYIEYCSKKTLRLSRAGCAKLAPRNPPEDNAAVQQRLCAFFKGNKTEQMFRVLCHGQNMLRSDLAAATGYTNLKSTGFVKALSQLSCLGLVSYPDKHSVVLTDICFPHGRPIVHGYLRDYMTRSQSV